MKVAEKGVLTSRVVPEAPVFAKDGHLQQGGGCQNNSCSASVYKDKHTKPLSGLSAHHALFFFFFFCSHVLHLCVPEQNALTWKTSKTLTRGDFFLCPGMFGLYSDNAGFWGALSWQILN